MAHHVFNLARELHLVGVVEENEVRKLEVTGNAAHAVSDFFFEAAVRHEAYDLVLQNVAKAFDHEAFGNRITEGYGMTDTERTRGVFDAEGDFDFGVARRAGAELAEILEVIHREVAEHSQFTVQERGHVAGVHEETVAGFPVGVFGVKTQEFREQKGNGICRTHCSTRMARLCLLHHGSGKDSNVVSRFCNQRVLHFFNLSLYDRAMSRP